MQKEDCLIRLEQAFRLWEDTCFLRKQEALFSKKLGHDVGYPIAGPMQNFPKLRQHIFSAKEFDQKAFLGKNEHWEALNKTMGFVFMLPFTLFGWNRGSRRVYYLTKEMELTLATTSLKNINWQDIRFPFSNFLVSLETPLVDFNGKKYDSILVTEYYLPNEAREISFHFFCSDLEEYQPLSGNTKQILQKKVRQNKRDWCAKKFLDLNEARKIQGGLECFFHPDIAPQLSILEFLEKHPQESQYAPGFHEFQSIKKEMARLVFGLCMFFRTTATQRYIKVEESKLKPAKAKLKQKFAPVTDEADLFAVSCDYVLDSRTKQVIQRIGDEIPLRRLKPHPRTSYWRRPIGKGKVPDYPKTEWVRDSYVNFELLVPGALPDATRQDIVEPSKKPDFD